MSKEVDKFLDKYIVGEGDWLLKHKEVISKLLDKYVSEQLILSDVSQQRELLLAYEEFTSYKVLGKKTPRISKQMVEDYLANNCG